MTAELAITMGTTNTAIYVAGNGIVLYEPTAIAYFGDPKLGKVRAVGKEAVALLGRSSDNTSVIYPITDGYITNPEACKDMLSEFLKKLFTPKLFGYKIKAIVGLPIGITIEERRIYDDIFAKIGLNEIIAVENIYLTAVGLNLPIHSHKMHFVVNIGGGITEISAISSSDIVKGCSISIGGNMMDKAVRDYVLGKFDFKLSLRTISKIKETIGSLYSNDTSCMTVTGVDLARRVPGELRIKATDIMEAIMPYYLRIADGVESVIKSVSPDVGFDLISGGLHFAGGGSNVLGLNKLMSERFSVPINVHADGEFSAIYGAGKLLSDVVLLNEILTKH
ncbi:MAG: rod shape-determining protein [Clostridia bacterium]|nr:rod shape-determining protein [Clostridia bacterium]